MKSIFIVFVLLLGLPAFSQSYEETEFILDAKELMDNTNGAAQSTKELLLSKNMQKYFLTDLSVGQLDVEAFKKIEEQKYSFSIESKLDVSEWMPSSAQTSNLLEMLNTTSYTSSSALYPTNTTITYLNRKTQDLQIYINLISEHSKLFEIRVGQKVNVNFKIISIEYIRPNSKFNYYYISIVGELQEILSNVKFLECENGHKYPESSGYKYCPRCGKKLQ